MDEVFKALADSSRSLLLDRLYARNGQTLGELCVDLDMTRQAVMKHLALLEAANLVVTIRRGREKLHYLNPVPIHEISERWIVYVTYIDASPEKVWQALTDGEFTKEYWAHRNVLDWKVGSRWEHQRVNDAAKVDVVGKVLESDPPRRLVLSWDHPHGEAGVSRVTFEIDLVFDTVRLTVIHDDLEPGSEMLKSISQGWPTVLSSLKSFLETGHGLEILNRWVAAMK